MTCRGYPVLLTLLYDDLQSCFAQKDFPIRLHLPAGRPLTRLVRVLKAYDVTATLTDWCEEAYLEAGANAENPLKESRITPSRTTLKGETAEDVIRTIVC